MSAAGAARGRREERALHAYHDGELRGFARRRFERRLARSRALQRELEALGLMAQVLRDADARAPAPDLWDAIERRLPDARDAAAQARERRGGLLAPLLRPVPVGALAAAALAAVLLARVWVAAPPEVGGVVRWIDSGDRDVMVLEGAGESELTIIWLLEGAPEGAARGDGRATA